MAAKLIAQLPVGNELGEGIQWRAKDASIWWTDIQQKTLYRAAWPSAEIERYSMPERLCSFAFHDQGDSILAAFESGLARLTPPNGGIEWLYKTSTLASNTRLNDGRVDRQGRFWVGSMVEPIKDRDKPVAELYCFEGKPGEPPRICERDIWISNGLCWSPEGDVMYFADSPRQTIYRYDFEGDSGIMSNRRVFATTPDGAYPDGANVDANGNLWSAHWGAGQVVCYSPDGAILGTVKTPASQPSCIAFGGVNRELLFVTSARENLSPEALESEPDAGNVFVYELSGALAVEGMAESVVRNY
ncbi:MAG: SMP-30/gluconolactonase/LRE family protein [Cellvibrionaceae bacterium]